MKPGHTRWAMLSLAGLALAMLTAEPALAQQQQQPRARAALRKKAVSVPAPVPKLPPPPANAQEKPLLELSEAIGGLTFLSQICSPATSPNPWRVRMETLLDNEGDNSGAREKMTGAFNHGFSDYSTTYRQCTDAARAARRVLRRDAARIAREIERRFGS